MDRERLVSIKPKRAFEAVECWRPDVKEIRPYRGGKASDVIAVTESGKVTFSLGVDVEWNGAVKYPVRRDDPVTKENVGQRVYCWNEGEPEVGPCILDHVIDETVQNRFVVRFNGAGAMYKYARLDTLDE